MRYHALACDYDGTIATLGHVPAPVIEGLERLKRTGRSLLLVTGRTQDELLRVFSRIDLFARIVLENGAVLLRPESGESEVLAPQPPPEFISFLQKRGVSPLGWGRAIVATREPHEKVMLDAIRELGLEMHVIFNKGGVMALPSGVNKATGLDAALRELKLSAHNIVGVGDAENDHAFLERCECSVGVANALSAVKEKADWVTAATEGTGVLEIIDHLIADDFAAAEARLSRHGVPLGNSGEGKPVGLKPYGMGILVAGPSESGKSTFAGGLMERLAEKNYQLCVVDPEGDYSDVEGFTSLGGKDRIPGVEEALDVLDRPGQHLALNLLGVTMDSRPAYFQKLFGALGTLQRATGRPHWMVLDEAHHLMPVEAAPVGSAELPKPDGVMLVTVDPAHLSPALWKWIDLAVFLGNSAGRMLEDFTKLLRLPPPRLPGARQDPGDALGWWRHRPAESFALRTLPSRLSRRRHLRKYAEGDLGPDKSFYFRGPEGKLRLRAQNLRLFLQMAEGVDDETWLFHLRQGDYSRWFREAIKDESLADEARAIETRESSDPIETRQRVRKLLEERYTAPA